MARKIPAKILEPRRGRRRIEQRAWSLLGRCRRTQKLDHVPLPVPVDDWIEGPLGIRFGISDLSYLGENVLGATYIAENEILIHDGLLGSEGRYRFTCAHELGHFVLHRDRDLRFIDFLLLAPQAARREREADRFAAAFLMPVPLFEMRLLAVAGSSSDGPYAYRDGGIEAVAARARGGSTARLPAEQQAAFIDRFKAGPTERDGGVCRLGGKDAVRILREEFGVEYTLADAYELLHRNGLSCLRPRPRHRKRDPEVQKQWLECAPFLSRKHGKRTKAKK